MQPIVEMVSLTFAVEDLRFIISELKQQEAWYQQRASEMFWQNKRTEAREYAQKMERCVDIAMGISRAMAGEKQGE